MIKLEIKEQGIYYYCYQNGEFIGKMDATQMLWFFVVYKINQADYEVEIVRLYSKALSVDTQNLIEIVNKLQKKFMYLLQYVEVDFTGIDFGKIFSNYDSEFALNRMRAFTPTMLAIGLTDRCFCQCLYCYAKKNGGNRENNKGTELDFDVVKQILNYARRVGISTVSLTGGDPMTYTKFWEVLELCKEYGIKVNFSTKKILSDSDIEKFLLLREQIDYIQLSIDSLYENEEVMMLNNVRAAKVMASLRKLNDLARGKLNITVNSVITKYNIDNILQLSKALKEMGNIKHTLSPYTFNFSTNNEEFFPTFEQYEELRRKISQMESQELLSYSIVIGDKNPERKKIICHAGIDALIISCDGNVYACERFCADKRFSLGNVYSDSIVDIWNSDRIKEFSNPPKALFEMSNCYACDSFEYCVRERGLCYIHSYLINKGNIYAPDYFCKHKEFLNDIRIY